MTKIGEVILILRKEKGIKQKHLAKYLGVSSSYLSQIEKSKRKPSLKILSRISDCLNISITTMICKAIDKDLVVDKNIESIITQIINYLK